MEICNAWRGTKYDHGVGTFKFAASVLRTDTNNQNQNHISHAEQICMLPIFGLSPSVVT